MRKTLIILIAVVSLVLGGLGVYWYLNHPKTDIEDVLPEDALLHVKFSNMQEAMEKVSKTQMWTALSAIRYEKIINGLDLPEGQRAGLLKIVQSFKEFKDNEFFQAFISREFAITAYPFELPKNVFLSGIQDVLQPALASFYVSIRLSPQAQALETLSKWATDLSDGQIEHQAKTYKDVAYDVFVLQGGLVSISAVKHGDVLVLALNEYPIRKSIDIVLTSRASLKEDAAYQKAEEYAFNEDVFFGYVNIDLLLSKGEGVFQDFLRNTGADADVTSAKETFDPYRGLKQLIFSSKWDDLIQKKLVLLYDSKDLSSQMARSFDSCQGQKTSAVDFVPAESIGYYWSGCLNLDYYWEQFKKDVIDEDSGVELTPEEKLASLEATVGASIEADVLPAFANEVGAFLVDIEGGGIFPIPQFAIFVEIKDQEKAEALLSKMLSKSFFVFQNEEFEGKIIKYFQSPIGQILEPGYIFFDKYLMIATKRSILKGALAAQKDSKLSLKSNAAFQTVDAGFFDKNVGSAYFEFNKIMTKLGGLVEVGNNVVTAKNEKQKAFQRGSEMRFKDTIEDIVEVESSVEETNEQIKDLKKEIGQLKSEGLDASAKESELNQLKEKIPALEAELADLNTQKGELEEILSQYQEPLMDTEGRRLILDELVYPFFKALSGIHAVSSVTKSLPGMFETNILIQLMQ